MSAITLHAKKTRGFDARVAHAVALLREAAEDHGGRIVQASSLGVEGMVLTDMIARHQLPITVATLDTGRLHAETLALIPRIEQRYGLQVQVYAPRQEQVLHFVRRHGENAMFESVDLRKACCDVRKVEPMRRLLEGRSAWVTGLRREQSDTRANVPFFEIDADGREKFYPLADWSEADVWQYVQQHDVPYNALHDQFFPSIGCAPCTRAVSLGEDHRAGRWWWEQDGAAKECGLHMRPAAQPEALTA
ncbi:phosphoadenylyl-sulfate reductase [Rubrivivax sp. RP6-9]|uniref:phosphoadenylyl-sulfate reductase n=1 Tax=Rubrivivax sp. RP6-9 TaxID=3415750 RepID=UPI003CC532D6